MHSTLSGLIAAGITAAMATAAVAQQTVVTWMHLESDPPVVAWMEGVEAAFEARNPDVDVQMQYVANEAFKARLTTMLQSDERPDVFYTWAGGVMRAQADAGVLQDISATVQDGWGETISAGALSAYDYNGAVHGVPWEVNQVGFWYNKGIFAEVGIDPENIRTWDDLLATVRTLHDAGVTPITTGGADKWPLHFYWTHLAIRIGGREAFQAAINSQGDGFAAAPFIQAGERFAELIALDPFQDGFLGMTFPESAGYFGDGNAAMQLQGSWNYLTQRTNSVSGAGLSDDQLGWFPFPVVDGGAGAPTDTLGGINGWLVTDGAPPETVAFLRFLTNLDNQTEAARLGVHIPVTIGAAEALENPFFRLHAENIARSDYHQIFYDQDLGPSVGRVVNDVSTDLAAGLLTPEEAARQVQEAWEFETM